MSNAAYAPVPFRSKGLKAGETHFYSFEVTETQKQGMGYKPLLLQYLCHLTDRRFVFELLSSSPDEMLSSTLQTVSTVPAQVVKQELSSQESFSQGNVVVTLPNTKNQLVFELDYETIAALKVVRTLGGSYAKIVVQSANSEEKAIVLAVRNVSGSGRQRNCAGDFIRLGKELLYSDDTQLSSLFQFNPKAVARFTQDVQTSEVPVLVDFWAPNCEPCQIFKPVIDEVFTHFNDRIRLIKINIEENPSIPMHYNVNCFPTLMLFKSGTIVEQVSGTVSAKLLIKVLNKHLVE
ncbi:MAG TPA: thioredoxin domain-containing protein [Trichocoleus sp.]|jgi:thioredoxin 1